MKKITIGVTAIAALALTATVGGAQAATPTIDVVHPATIKIGAFFPSNGNNENAGGHTQFSAGLDYAITKTTQTNPSIPSVYLDYQGGTRNGGHINTIGLGVAIRSQSVNKSGSNPYFGGGLGLYDVSAKPGRDYNSKTGIVVGGKIFGGYEFKGGFLVEASYQLITKENGVNPSGLGVQVGYRF